MWVQTLLIFTEAFLLATLTAWCEHHQIPYEGIPVGTIKKATTGKGNASKKKIKAVCAKGHTPKDDNEADALAILYLMKEGGYTCPINYRGRRLFADKWILDLACLSPFECKVYIKLRLQMLYTGKPLLII